MHVILAPVSIIKGSDFTYIHTYIYIHKNIILGSVSIIKGNDFTTDIHTYIRISDSDLFPSYKEMVSQTNIHTYIHT